MNLAVQARVEVPEGLRLTNFMVNLRGGASFHSASPIVPSIVGAAAQDPDATVLGSSGCWTRSRLISRVRFMKDSTARDGGRFRVVDVGCGTGHFVLDAAAARPDRDYLGIEAVASLVDQATQEAAKRGLRNARFVAEDASRWIARQESGSVDEIHVYHPQPYY